jgi:hypothetical protein
MGRQISWGGLRKTNTTVRVSFSVEFQEYLKGLNGGFENLGDFRHALAHRIPLHTPPYSVPGAKMAACLGLAGRKGEALGPQT